MERYVDGYVLPIPEENVDEYREMASEAGRFWIEAGALGYYECVGDDLYPDVGSAEMATFPDIMDTEADEAVIFAFVIFESREHRDEVNAAVWGNMDGDEDTPMPFEVERMAYGGFQSIVAYGD